MIAFAFSAILLRQYLGKRRPYALVWTISLTIGGLAGLMFVLFLTGGRNVFFFRLYYLFGALLMAAYLGLGSIYLLAPRRAANITALVLVLLSIAGTVVLFLTPITGSVLQGSNVEAGTHAVSGPVIAFVAVLNTFGAIAVIGGACYSAWRLWKRRGPPRLLAANVLIAIGTLLASLAGTLARITGSGAYFWFLLAAGFVVLFAGFLLTAVPMLTPRPVPEVIST